jgi:protein-disulfide isomerase
MHFWAQVAAEAAMSAGAQGKFFEFDELVFRRQAEITPMLQQRAKDLGTPDGWRSVEVQRAVFADLAAEAGADAGRVRQELETGRWTARVQAEAAEATRLGATGTPSSFVNGRYLSGAQPFASFQAQVQKEIDWARNGNRPNFPKGTSVSQMLAQQRAAAPSGPDPNKVYPLKAGEAPFEGPAEARVTILHYLDYQ